ncbi:hypothetical protein C6P44_002969 [Monosporozyma unispora]|nr:hypothetical protein C6P44_002969 [Kazachstania unispora]
MNQKMKQKYMPKIRRRCNPSTILRENIKNAPTLQKNMRKFILNMKEYIDKSDDGLTAYEIDIHLWLCQYVEDYLNFECDEDSDDNGEEIMDPTYIPD